MNYDADRRVVIGSVPDPLPATFGGVPCNCSRCILARGPRATATTPKTQADTVGSVPDTRPASDRRNPDAGPRRVTDRALLLLVANLEAAQRAWKSPIITDQKDVIDHDA